MNVRDATPDDEPWILRTLDELGTRDRGFRWHRYVVVETDDGERVGTGRLTERGDDAVQLTHVGAVGDREAYAAAYAVKGLVERAIRSGYETVLAAPESTRPFEAVGFEEVDAARASAIDASDAETVLRWKPASERGDESASESTVEGDEQASDDASYKYDTEGSSQPADGSAGANAASESSSTEQSADGSVDAAARRQGIDPDSVETKYGTEGDGESKRTKYEA